MPNLPSIPAKTIDGNASQILPYIPTTTGGFGDARGWRRAVRSITALIAGRSFALRTDDAIQTGPPPSGVRRLDSDKSGGYLDSRGVGTFPIHANSAYIPHMPTIVNRGLNPTPYRTVDDAVTIPATYAGNPQ